MNNIEKRRKHLSSSSRGKQFLHIKLAHVATRIYVLCLFPMRLSFVAGASALIAVTYQILIKTSFSTIFRIEKINARSEWIHHVSTAVICEQHKIS